MNINLRPITPKDRDFLRQMLYLSVFVPPGAAPYDRSIVQLPEISKYIDGWGTKKDDFGIIACISDVPAGAVWARLFGESGKGFGFVDDKTPELVIAIMEGFRNKGLGKMLMEQFFLMAIERGYRKVSLSVDKINPAFRFYQRLGFVTKGGTDQSPTMVKVLM